MMMDLLDDILAKLPKPAPPPPPSSPPATPPATPPSTPPAGAPSAGTPALGEDGKPLPQKPGGKTIHAYGDQFKQTFGERKS